MERGTEWERRALREQWAVMERRRALVTRLLGGLTLVGGGVVILLLAVAGDVCETTVRGGVIGCTPATDPSVGVLLALVGVGALGAGSWLCWTGIGG